MRERRISKKLENEVSLFIEAIKENSPLSREFLIEQDECCGSGCLNCPYIPKNKKGSIRIQEEYK